MRAYQLNLLAGQQWGDRHQVENPANARICEKKEEPKRKEEPLLQYYDQGNSPYCALCALATLKQINPEHVIKTAKRICSGTGTRYTGRWWQIIAIYKALGHTHPFKSGQEPQRRTKNLKPESLKGSGYLRIQKRKTSKEGHQVCYHNGIVYDSARDEPMTAHAWIEDRKKRWRWVIVRREKPTIII